MIVTPELRYRNWNEQGRSIKGVLLYIINSSTQGIHNIFHILLQLRSVHRLIHRHSIPVQRLFQEGKRRFGGNRYGHVEIVPVTKDAHRILGQMKTFLT